MKRHIDSVHECVRYPCDHCNYQAKQKCHLKSHLQSVHGIKIAPGQQFGTPLKVEAQLDADGAPPPPVPPAYGGDVHYGSDNSYGQTEFVSPVYYEEPVYQEEAVYGTSTSGAGYDSVTGNEAEEAAYYQPGYDQEYEQEPEAYEETEDTPAYVKYLGYR